MYKHACNNCIEGSRNGQVETRICKLTRCPVSISTCQRCHDGIPPTPGEKTIQSGINPKVPNLTTRVATWANAVTSWISAGSPKRSEEEVNHIHETYCKPCPWNKNNVCSSCGCNVTTSSHPLINKIKMATQHCPKELW